MQIWIYDIMRIALICRVQLLLLFQVNIINERRSTIRVLVFAR